MDLLLCVLIVNLWLEGKVRGGVEPSIVCAHSSPVFGVEGERRGGAFHCLRS